MDSLVLVRGPYSRSHYASQHMFGVTSKCGSLTECLVDEHCCFQRIPSNLAYKSNMLPAFVQSESQGRGRGEEASSIMRLHLDLKWPQPCLELVMRFSNEALVAVARPQARRAYSCPRSASRLSHKIMNCLLQFGKHRGRPETPDRMQPQIGFP